MLLLAFIIPLNYSLTTLALPCIVLLLVNLIKPHLLALCAASFPFLAAQFTSVDSFFSSSRI